MYMWERIGEMNASTFLDNLWERGSVNLIMLPNIADGMNKMTKHIPSQYVACNFSYIWRCLILFQCMYGRE